MADKARISELPDDIRLKILSLLPGKDAVATAILSHKWKDLSHKWKDLYTPRGEVRFEFNSTHEDRETLYNFIKEELLITGVPPLLKFVLQCNLYKERRPIEHMLHAVTQKRLVLELEVCVKPDKEKGVFQLPEYVLTSQHLKYLRLCGVSVRVPDGTPALQSLKRLQVDISLKSDISLQYLYAKCPVLQELTLEGNIDNLPRESDKRVFDVYSPSLKTLQIKLETDFEFGLTGHHAPDPIYSFYIYAPKLENLLIEENMLACYRVHNLETTVEARLQIGWRDVGYEFTDPKSLNDVFSLLRGLTNVQSLTLYNHTTAAAGFILKEMYQAEFIAAERAGQEMSDADNKDWSLYRNALPIFCLLTELNLHVSNHFGCRTVMYLLDQTPALKLLVIQMVERDDVERDQRFAWTPPPVTPECVRKNSLKKVQLKGFLGHEEEWSPMINYFQDIARSTESSQPGDAFLLME